jgi:pimeloyl-ACP methyl ester carboxylesterase
MAHTIPVPQTFTHSTRTHTSTIHWTCLGSPNSPLPPLILIHGTPWSSAVYSALATALSSHYRIYLYDHPGFGLSPPPTRVVSTGSADEDKMTDLDPSLTLRAAFSAALIASWALPSPPHILAHDNGGLVALRLLLQHHIPIRSLCLIDVVVLPPFGLPFFKLVAENESVFRAIPAELQEGLVRAYIRSAAFNPLPEGVEDMLCKPWVGGEVQEGRFLREMVQAHYRDTQGLEGTYADVGEGTPIKVIWGLEDKWIPVDTAGRVAEALGAREVVRVQEAGHLIMYDQPGRLAVEVAEWLGKNGVEGV